MKHLHFVALPRLDESPRSLLQRTAIGNGAGSVRRLQSWFDPRKTALSLSHLIGDSDLVGTLARETQTHVTTFMSSFYVRRGRFTREQPVRLMAADVPPAWLRISTRAVCPDCIAQGWSKSIHDLSFVDACPYHALALHSSCASCSAPLGWLDSRFDRCGHCNVRLADSERTQVDAHGAKRVLDCLRAGDSATLRAVVDALRILGHEQHLDRERRNAALNLAVRIVDGEVTALTQALRDDISRTPGLPLAAIAAPWLTSVQTRLQTRVASMLDQTQILHRPGPCTNCQCGAAAFIAAEVSHFLNVTNATIRKLVDAQVLKRTPGSGSWHWRYPKSSFCRLVALLQPKGIERTSGDPLMPTGVGAPSLIERLRAIEAGQLAVGHVDWSQGLHGVRVERLAAAQPTRPADAISVAQAADQLGTYPDAVRRVIKAGKLSAFHAKRTGTTVWIRPADLEGFKREFVFLTALAAQMGSGRTTLSTKLEHMGVQPISGPRIDGALVPLYRCSDLARVDLTEVVAITQFAPRSGRRKGDPEKFATNKWMSSTQAASVLRVSVQKLGPLIEAGLLVPGTPPGRDADNRRYFARGSVLRTRQWIVRALPLDGIARAAGLDPTALLSRFVRTGLITPVWVGPIRMISCDDARRITAHMSMFVTCAEAGHAYNAPIKHFSQLVRTQRFRASTPRESGSTKSLLLLRRTEVEAYARSIAE